MNKQIKPFYKFSHKNKQCLINIEDMHAEFINEASSEILEQITIHPEAALEFSVMEHLKELNLLSESEEQGKEEAKKEPVPIINVALFTTQSCNLKCVYCYGEDGSYGTGGVLKQETAYQAVDWLIKQSGNMKKIHIGFFGGEPFLNFQIMKIVTEYAKKKVISADKKVSFYITTNATLLDAEKIEFLKENNVSVTVSCDGPKEIQDAQRPFANGTGTYNVIAPKIKELLKELPETVGHAVIQGDTDPNLVKKALQEIGFSKISITPASESLFNEKAGNKKYSRNLNELLNNIEQESEKWIHYTKTKEKDLLKKLVADGILYQPVLSFLHNSKNEFPCGAGLGLAGVSCSGDIFLCHRFVGMDEYKLGNIFDNNFNRDKYNKSPLMFIDKCSKCFAKYFCGGGGCKHDNAAACGSLFIPSEDLCRIRQHEFELAAYITSMLDHEDRSFLIEYDIFPPKPCPFDFV